MSVKPIRISQLIAPFGPGSIYTDRKGIPHVVCGLDHWFMREDPMRGLVACDDRTEFERAEPRLSALLGVDRFCIPPDFRINHRGQMNTPNARLHIPAQRFPRWYRNTRSGELRKFNLHSTRIDNPANGGRWQPVRFIAVCRGGHLCEFPWKEWINCQCPGDGNLVLTDRGGSELSSIRVECHSCPDGSQGRKGKSLAGTTRMPATDSDDGGPEQSEFERAGISCPGDRPWLGEGASEYGCSFALVGALINQTNLYFPKIMTAIALPIQHTLGDDVTHLIDALREDPALGIARTLWRMPNRDGAVALISSSLAARDLPADPAQVEQALEILFQDEPLVNLAGIAPPRDPEPRMLGFRRAEYCTVRTQVNSSDLRTFPAAVPQELSPWISRINLVERLRETRVFYGFDRLDQRPTPLEGMPDSAMRQLFRFSPDSADRWLPAIEVFGEGIYVELCEERLINWQRQHEPWLSDRLNPNYRVRLGDISLCLPPPGPVTTAWASRYLLVHSLAHILINQLVFECGYSTAALRERLYVSSDVDAPMAAFLIYTAAGDSEGTLGGLVRLGRPELFWPVVSRALSRAAWCSADPVCSEQLGGRGPKLVNLAACHACVLLPETCCETINHGLDRAMVVGTPENRDVGFMSALISNYCERL